MTIDTNKLVRGLWSSPYMKVYSLGGDERVAELSTYPRAYKDTAQHVYGVDTPFIVSESDLNFRLESGERVYQDSKNSIFRVGEAATHFANDNLPGVFPLWLESEALPDPPMVSTEHKFPVTLDIMFGQLVSVEILEVAVKQGASLVMVSVQTLDKIKNSIRLGEVAFPKGIESKRQVIYVRYRRRWNK